MSRFFASGGQNIGVSASASVLPMNIQDWFPLRLTGLISLQSKGLSRVFSNTTVQKHQFFSPQLSLRSHLSLWSPFCTSEHRSLSGRMQPKDPRFATGVSLAKRNAPLSWSTQLGGSTRTEFPLLAPHLCASYNLQKSAQQPCWLHLPWSQPHRDLRTESCRQREQ